MLLSVPFFFLGSVVSASTIPDTALSANSVVIKREDFPNTSKFGPDPDCSPYDTFHRKTCRLETTRFNSLYCTDVPGRPEWGKHYDSVDHLKKNRCKSWPIPADSLTFRFPPPPKGHIDTGGWLDNCTIAVYQEEYCGGNEKSFGSGVPVKTFNRRDEKEENGQLKCHNIKGIRSLEIRDCTEIHSQNEVDELRKQLREGRERERELKEKNEGLKKGVCPAK